MRWVGVVAVGSALVGCAAAPVGDGDDTDDTDDTDAAGYVAVDVPACLRDPSCRSVLGVAHRGAHADAPENSVASVEAAAVLGVHLVEVDVRHTKDGALVCMHDGDVDRTTDGTGDVSELTLAELGALTLDAPEGDGVHRIPTFEEVLDVAVRTGLGVYVDTKTDRVDLVTDAIVAAGAEDHALVRKDRGAVGPALDAGLLVIVPVGSEAELPGGVDDLPADAFVELATPSPNAALAAAVREAGFRVQQDVFLGDASWPLVGTFDGWRTYLEAGVQMPQTEYPEGLMEGLRTGALPAVVE